MRKLMKIKTVCNGQEFELIPWSAHFLLSNCESVNNGSLNSG